jgi:hypothetical protein
LRHHASIEGERAAPTWHARHRRRRGSAVASLTAGVGGTPALPTRTRRAQGGRGCVRRRLRRDVNLIFVQATAYIFCLIGDESRPLPFPPQCINTLVRRALLLVAQCTVHSSQCSQHQQPIQPANLQAAASAHARPCLCRAPRHATWLRRACPRLRLLNTLEQPFSAGLRWTSPRPARPARTLAWPPLTGGT